MLVLVAGPVARAEDPRPINEAVYNASGLLSANEVAALTQDAAALESATGVSVRFAFPQSFSGISTWAAESARLSEVAGPTMVMAASVDDGRGGWAVSNDFPLGKEAITEIVNSFTYRSFEDWHFAYGCYQLLQGLGYALGAPSLPVDVPLYGLPDPTSEPTDAEPTPTETFEFTPDPAATIPDDPTTEAVDPTPIHTETPSPTSTGAVAPAWTSGAWAWVIAAVVLYALIQGGFLIARRRRTAASAPRPPVPGLATATRQAGECVVKADAALEAARAELAFAEAQFSQEDTADLRLALRRAESEMTAVYQANKAAGEIGSKRERALALAAVARRAEAVSAALGREVRAAADRAIAPGRVGEVLDDLHAGVERATRAMTQVRAEVAGAVARRPAAADGASRAADKATERLEAAGSLLLDARRAQQSDSLEEAGRLAHQGVRELAAAETLAGEARRIAAAVRSVGP